MKKPTTPANALQALKSLHDTWEGESSGYGANVPDVAAQKKRHMTDIKRHMGNDDEVGRVLQRVHDHWKSGGDARSRYGHEVRGTLRRAGVIPSK